MNIRSRYSLALAGGAVSAFLTAQIMIILIDADFEPQEKIALTSFEVNPVAPDIKPIQRKTEIQTIKKVTPPPPPMIGRVEKTQPTEKFASLKGAIPLFLPPKISQKPIALVISDRDAQPLVRTAPTMPPRAQKSGHCKVRFDVSPDGAPYNVLAIYCSQSLFESASLKAVHKWKYNPKIVNGNAVARSGVENQITFKLSDERGRLIPE